MLKRVFDLLGALIGLIAAAPLLAVLIVLVRRDSPGPGLFAQERVGRDGRLFVCRKLRTMRHGVAQVPTHETSAAELTSLGARLRRAKLDELPQLWNVLLGDMSLVGPRPSLPSQTILIEERRRLGVLALRPGITGLAQIRGIDMSEPLRLARTDAEYLATRSFAGDLAILSRTVLGGRGRGDPIGQ